MSQKSGNFDDVLLLGRVPVDQPLLSQLLQEVLAVAVIVGENLDLDSLRSILQASISIGYRPQPSEEQPAKRFAFRKLIVGEETRFDVSRTCH